MVDILNSFNKSGFHGNKLTTSENQTASVDAELQMKVSHKNFPRFFPLRSARNLNCCNNRAPPNCSYIIFDRELCSKVLKEALLLFFFLLFLARNQKQNMFQMEQKVFARTKNVPYGTKNVQGNKNCSYKSK